MSFLARKAVGMNLRRYSTAPGPASKSTSPAIYIGIGVVGIAAAYGYLQYQPAAVAPSKAPLVSALDKDNFLDFKLKKVEKYNHNTSKFTFELAPGTASLLPVASCVMIKTAPGQEDPSHPPLLNEKGKPFVRPYTPISDPEKPEEMTFLIKKYETGKVTPYLHDMQPGQSIAIKGPFPKTPYEENKYDHIGMIAGGSGLTPMYQIIQHALALPNDKTKITFIFSNVTEKDILMKETLDAWAAKHSDRLKIVYALDKPSDNWKGVTGFITADVIKKYLPAPSEKTQILVCGPPPQVATVAGPKDGMKQGALAGALAELGYKPEQVFKF